MSQIKELKERSFLVYGLGLSGLSVIKFLKKIKLKIIKFGMITKKNILKKNRSKNLIRNLTSS